MRLVRRRSGQASLEYVALIALVVVVITAAAALTSGGLGTEVAYGLRRGLCAVSGTKCPPRPRDVADLPPCPTGRSSRTEDFNVSVAFVRLGGGLGVLEERTSDGRVTVTFTNSGTAGLTAGVGAHFAIGKLRIGAGAGGDIGVTFSTGRSWAFANQTAADAFVHHYGSDQTMAGRLGNDARRACLPCQIVGWEPDTPPPPQAVFLEGGTRAGFRAVAGAGVHAGLRATLEGVLGRRTGGDGTTWYVRLDATAAARLFAGLGLGATTGASAFAELTDDRTGRPVRLVVRLARRSALEATPPRPPGATRPPRFAGSGGLTEVETSLDLTDAANREAALGFLGGGSSSPLLARMREQGVSTTRSYRLQDTHDGVDGAVGVGAVGGAGYNSDSQGLVLTGVSTRLPGIGFLPRADCLAQ
jgi:hypothetical protein